MEPLNEQQQKRQNATEEAKHKFFLEHGEHMEHHIKRKRKKEVDEINKILLENLDQGKI